MLGLGYPGGPALERLAADGDARGVRVPRLAGRARARRARRAPQGVRRQPRLLLRGRQDGAAVHDSASSARSARASARADLAASYQAAIVETLALRAEQALAQTGLERLAVGGGVAANGALRRRLRELDATLHVPPRALCTDNAAMIASAARFGARAGLPRLPRARRLRDRRTRPVERRAPCGKIAKSVDDAVARYRSGLRSKRHRRADGHAGARRGAASRRSSGRFVFRGERGPARAAGRRVRGDQGACAGARKSAMGRCGSCSATAPSGRSGSADAMVCELDEDGRIRRITPHLRPWLALTLLRAGARAEDRAATRASSLARSAGVERALRAGCRRQSPVSAQPRAGGSADHRLLEARLPPVRGCDGGAARACSGELALRAATSSTSRADDALHRAYFERIPVVALDGEELCDYFVDEALVRERLESRR